MNNSKFRFESRKFLDLNEKLTVPSYQRGLVWGKSQKEEYIDTVKNGYPFGTFLIHEDQEKGRYSLIDGLQRFSTLRDYYLYPSKYLNLESALVEQIEEFFVEVEKIHQYPLKSELEKYIIDIFYKHLSDVQISKDWKLHQAILKSIIGISVFSDSRYYELINAFVWKCIEHLEGQVDLQSLNIPVIIFTGEKKDLPEIFQKMNSNGTQLSKYDIFAAAWSSYEGKIDDKDILNLVVNKYQDMLESQLDIQIEDFDADEIKNEKIINLYEYCFALGEIIKDEATHIISGSGNKSESLGFSAMTSFLQLHLKNMDELPNIININEDEKFLIDIKSKLQESAKLLNDNFKTYVEPLFVNSNNKKNSNPSYYKYIESQFIALLITVFKIHFDLDLRGKKITGNLKNREWNSFKKFAFHHYFEEVITNKWAGSGDNTLFSEIIKPLEKSKYLEPIDKIDYELNLNSWMKRQLEKTTETIDLESKLFLNQLFKAKYKSNRIDISYDFEHIIPKKWLKGKSVPKSSVGNLCFLPSKVNRRKKDQTLYQYFGELQTIKVVEENTYDLMYPTKDELYKFTGARVDEDEFKAFVNDRINNLLNRFRDDVLNLL